MNIMLLKNCRNMILDEAFLVSYHVSEERYLERQNIQKMPQEAMIFPDIHLKWGTADIFHALFYFFGHDRSKFNTTVVFS